VSLPALAQEERHAVIGPAVNIIDEEIYARRSQEAWENVVDRTNASYLDQHITQFPDATSAQVAFSVRYELMRQSASIVAYNKFIMHYADRAATPQAIGEVWELYRQENRFSGYVDFMRRYPNTPHAVVAKYHAQQQAFEFVLALDTVADYETYLQTFPDAPQVEAAQQKAAIRMRDDEQALYEQQRDQLSHDRLEVWVRKRARELAAQYGILLDVVDVEQPAWRSVKVLIDEGMLPEQTSAIDPVTRRNLGYRMDWIYYTLTSIKPYRITEGFDLLRSEARHQQIMAKLREIQSTLVRNNEKLIDMLKEEFGHTRDVLKQGFEALIDEGRATRRVMEEGFQRLEQSMDQLHTDLVHIHNRLVDMHRDIRDISGSLHQAHRYLAGLDASLSRVNQHLTQINRDMNRGFTHQAELTRQLTQDVRSGFQRQLAVSNRILAVNQEQLGVQRQTLQKSTEQLHTLRNILTTNRQQLGTSQQTLATNQRHLEVSGTILSTNQRSLQVAERNLAVNTEQLQVGHANLAANRSQLEVAQAHLDVSKQQVEIAQTSLRVARSNLAANREQAETAQRHFHVARNQLAVSERHLDTAQENLTTSRRILTANRAQLDQAKQQVALQLRNVQAVQGVRRDLTTGFTELGTTMRVGYTRLERPTWGASTAVQHSNLTMVAHMNQQTARVRQGAAGGSQPSALAYILSTAAAQQACPECPPETQSVLSQAFGALATGEQADNQQLMHMMASAGVKEICQECPPETAAVVAAVLAGEDVDQDTLVQLGSNAGVRKLCPTCPPDTSRFVSSVATAALNGEEIDSRQVYQAACRVGGTMVIGTFVSPAAATAEPLVAAL
jgi:hypothetical protein